MKKSELKKEIRNSVLEKKAKTDEMSTSGAAGGYDTPYAFRRPGAKPNDEEMLKLGYKPVKEDLSSDKKEALLDLQDILDRAAQLGEEAKGIVEDHFPLELGKEEAYEIFNFGSSANQYDNTLSSFINGIEQAADEYDEDELEEDLSAYKKTPMKMGDLETNDDGVKKPIYLNYGYKIVDKSKS